ncbi:hypothetical protein [Maribacter hydrothermalis]|uniref:Uncharacterized protein n=1 Tax=Maribacter hydrothermalis TaxID=1836467 RepID=A0A1B7Z720_9FLAO|nr:hypothetical protein [Maribacter hydrothermalis]APQ16406.1 hypothetical protein BTR34_03200 [Maribacter hydrothermalis]OBR38508.1 hypothetical protein A9200_17710 [Maribacter hydrothermalis]
MRVFQETQRFTQWWLQLINLTIVGLLFYGFYKWFYLGESMGNITADDSDNQIIFTLIIVLCLPLIYMFKLKTTIDEVGIHYQFTPINLSKKTIRWSELKNCYVRTYNPLKEFGGWGYRNSFGKSSAINVKGNIGIQLILMDGKKLLIGTQKENDAKIIIERYFKTNNE